MFGRFGEAHIKAASAFDVNWGTSLLGLALVLADARKSGKKTKAPSTKTAGCTAATRHHQAASVLHGYICNIIECFIYEIIRNYVNAWVLP